MTDNAERWRNVAQAAQWLAEGRQVQGRGPSLVTSNGERGEWWNLGLGFFATGIPVDHEYRLAPDPPKTKEWTLSPVLVHGWPYLGAYEGSYGQGIRVREVIE